MIPTTMRAAVLKGPQDLAIDEVPVPAPRPGQVLIRVEGCGVCASNVEPWEGQPWSTFPGAPGGMGHESWGTVAALGAGVEGLAPGTRVAALSERAYAEYDLADAPMVVPLPPELDGKPVPGEPVACAMNIFARSDIRAGQAVAIVGIGFLGAILTRLATDAGARVIAVSRRAESLDLARSMGAAEAVVMDDHWRIIEDVKLKYGHPTQPSAIEEGLILYYLQEVISPRRIAGQMLLVHETTDQTSGGRNAWLFNPGMGRTRRAPNVGYDNPKVSADGLMFNDQTDMFNGALDRYQWNLVGKREMLIPYNALHMIKPSATYEALVGKGHLNPDFTRYELHRVWVVEATLKPALRHSFRRRVFYVDEDSWSIALVDNYDDRGELWRFQEAHLSTFPFVPATTGSPEVHYDLHSGRYFVTASFAGDSYPDFNQDFEDSYFRSQALGSRSLRR